jgi:hypothetical protein
VETTPVVTTDLFPTLEQMTGGDVASADGVSLASLLKDGRPLAPRALYWHYLDCHRFYYCFDVTGVMIEGGSDRREGPPCHSWNTPTPRPSWLTRS